MNTQYKPLWQSPQIWTPEEVERAKDTLWSLDRRKSAGETITLTYIGPDTEVFATYTPIPRGVKLEFLGHITASISARVRLPNGETVALPLHHLTEKRTNAQDLTLADRAELWYKEQAHTDPPPRNTEAWREMYERWIDHAFGPEK